MSNRERVIIDTDIGDDIDDALAVALAIESRELEVIGITTVYKNTIARAEIAAQLIKDCGAGYIPVVPGSRKVMSGCINEEIDLDEMPRQYAVSAGKVAFQKDIDAVDFMESILKREKEPITIITLGALTNIAALISRNADIAANIKTLVIMGGAYFSHIKEYNICCDPEAARIVFGSGINITAVGLDVTLQCKLTEEELNIIKHSNKASAKAVYRLIDIYQKKIPGAEIFLHDPLAVAAAINPGLVQLKERKIAVETQGLVTTGMTFNLSDSNWWLEHDPSNIKVAKKVDRNGLVKMFLNRIAGWPDHEDTNRKRA